MNSASLSNGLNFRQINKRQNGRCNLRQTVCKICVINNLQHKAKKAKKYEIYINKIDSTQGGESLQVSRYQQAVLR